MTTSHRILVPSLVLAAVLLGACGGDDDADDAAADAVATATVTIERSRFAPDPVEITTGSEVAFENLDAFAHTVTSVEGSEMAFDSGQLGQDETFTQTFDEAGTYGYFCEIHPTMRAEVIVS
jgi:plastocyanin